MASVRDEDDGVGGGRLIALSLKVGLSAGVHNEREGSEGEKGSGNEAGHRGRG